jgi:lipopolysaccharide transport system ATP-binding protein
VQGRLAALIEIGAGFHDDLTGRENVFLNGVILGMTRAEVARKFDQIVDFAGLAPFIDTPVKHYSSGMYARLGFAVAAHLDPDILVIDEVLSVGDFVFQQKSLNKMRSVAKSGATVLFVSHNLKAVSELCARTLLLDAGTVVCDGPTSAVIETYLNRERTRSERRDSSEVSIVSVEVRSRAGQALHLRPGDKAWVDVRFAAVQRSERVAVILSFLGEGLDEIFNTSSERLGLAPMDLAAGEARSVSFELDMHLAPGTFHVAVYLYRYDVQKEYDRVLPAATFFVESDTDVRGSANLYPRVTSGPA